MDVLDHATLQNARSIDDVAWRLHFVQLEVEVLTLPNHQADRVLQEREASTDQAFRVVFQLAWM